MKKLNILLLILCFSSIVFSQVPKGFNYQAVLRNASGEILTNENTNIEISILHESATGTSIFTETHSTTTNNFGLINLQIGSVNASNFEAIDWSNGPYFVKITVDGVVMGTSQLLSVPYALYAQKAGSSYWNKSHNVLHTDHSVGIGTSSVESGLEVQDKPVLFHGGTGTLSASGPGTRFMWIPEKSALRAGYVDGAQWDSINIGDKSVAMGINTMADAYASVALGVATRASGPASVALGDSTESYGMESFAMGYNNNAVANYSVALGFNTEAQSYASVVLGQYNKISQASGNWLDTDPVFVIGNGTSPTERSNALTILKNGNASVGTTSEWAKVNVGGQLNVEPGSQSWGSQIVLNSQSLAKGKSFSLTSTGGNAIEGSGKFLIRDADYKSFLVIDSSGNTGVGTVYPYAKLHVDSSWILGTPLAMPGFGTSAVLNTDMGILYQAGGTDWAHHFVAYSTGDIARFGNSTGVSAKPNTKLVIDSMGYIGVGTPNPQSMIHIGNSLGDASTGLGGGYRTWMQKGLLVSWDSDHLFLGLKNDGIDQKNAVIAWGDNKTLDDLSFVYTDEDFETDTEIMRVSSKGNLGIGTTVPEAKLQVKDGDVYVETIAKGVIIKSPDNTCWRITVDNSGNIQTAAVPCP